LHFIATASEFSRTRGKQTQSILSIYNIISWLQRSAAAAP
jgi:hypothetical protein